MPPKNYTLKMAKMAILCYVCGIHTHTHKTLQLKKKKTPKELHFNYLGNPYV